MAVGAFVIQGAGITVTAGLGVVGILATGGATDIIGAKISVVAFGVIRNMLDGIGRLIAGVVGTGDPVVRDRGTPLHTLAIGVAAVGPVAKLAIITRAAGGRIGGLPADRGRTEPLLALGPGRKRGGIRLGAVVAGAKGVAGGVERGVAFFSRIYNTIAAFFPCTISRITHPRRFGRVGDRGFALFIWWFDKFVATFGGFLFFFRTIDGTPTFRLAVISTIITCLPRINLSIPTDWCRRRQLRAIRTTVGHPR